MIIQHNGIQLSSLPTQNHKLLIHVRINTLLAQKMKEQYQIDKNPKHQFELSTTKLHIKAYVDPSELSYSSYENILNLDECYFGPKFYTAKNIPLKFTDMERIQNYYKFKIHDPENVLMQLHKMNLYSLPFNNLSRGGKRMIFSSYLLADSLRYQVDQCFSNYLQDEKEYEQVLENFKEVNHVFRLNCFSPSSGNFKTHYDTPFSDNQRKLYSKFTLLIYLTGGSNAQNPCLRIQDEKINEIPAFTGIIFDQQFQHQGWPYIEGEKIFLRSELIYHIKDIDQDQRVAEIFNKACYFHKESLASIQSPQYSQQLQKYSNDLFNHTAKLRYKLALKKEEIILEKHKKQLENQQQSKREQKIEIFTIQQGQKYLLKKNLDVFYVTNGNDFWFLDVVPLKLAAKLVLVDYFNGRMDILSKKKIKETLKMKIKSKIFNLKLAESYIKNQKQNHDNKMQEQNQASNNLSQHDQQKRKLDEGILGFMHQFSFQDEDQFQKYRFDFSKIVETEIKDYSIMEYHCGICEGGNIYTSESYEKEAMDIALEKLQQRMAGIGVILFNGKVHIDDGCIVVDQQKGEVRFNQAFLNKAINFASCQCETYRRQKVIAKQMIQVQGFYLPNIQYKKLQDLKGYRFSIDMFKNGFIHRVKSKVPRPYAVNPKRSYPESCFFNNDDSYNDSDDSDDEYENSNGRKRKPQSSDPILQNFLRNYYTISKKNKSEE